MFFSDVPWSNQNEYDLHELSAASQNGYGACVYIRTKIGNSYQTTFVISKS